MMQLLSAMFLLGAMMGSTQAAGIDCQKASLLNTDTVCCPEPNDTLLEDFAKICDSAGDVYCIIECIYNATGILGANGDVNIEMVRKYLREAVTDDPDYIPVMEKAYEKCGLKVQKELTEKPSSKISKCRLYGNALAECTSNEIFNNCPSSKWKNTTECNNQRDFIKKCVKF